MAHGCTKMNLYNVRWLGAVSRDPGMRSMLGGHLRRLIALVQGDGRPEDPPVGSWHPQGEGSAPGQEWQGSWRRGDGVATIAGF